MNLLIQVHILILKLIQLVTASLTKIIRLPYKITHSMNNINETKITFKPSNHKTNLLTKLNDKWDITENITIVYKILVMFDAKRNVKNENLQSWSEY